MPNLQKKRQLIFDIFNIKKCTLFLEPSISSEMKKKICSLCTLNEVEDEYHFLLNCPAYNKVRHLYLKKYYYNKPSMLKLIQLLNCENVKVLNGIRNFLYKC